MMGADIYKTVDYFRKYPEEWQQFSDRVTHIEDFFDNWKDYGVFHLPHGGARKMRLVREAIARGEYFEENGLCRDLDVFGLLANKRNGPVLVVSCNFAVDHLDIRVHSRAELEARRLVPEIARFLITHLPGFENAYVSESASMVGVRFSRWIDSGFDLTFPHIMEGARFDDVVGVQAAHE